jgi:hypothetical protein
MAISSIVVVPDNETIEGGGVQLVSRRASASHRFHHVVRVGVRIVEAGVGVRKVPHLGAVRRMRSLTI